MKKLLFALSILFTSLFSLSSAAQDATLRKEHFNLDENVAISGYDPVAYFKSNAAIRGQNSLAVFHQGVVYYFSSPENKEEFKKSPSRYEPEYGGWCAYAMGAKGSKVDINPETFKIVNGKLLLFYNKRGNNTLLTWNKDEPALKPNADVNWKKILY